QRNEFSDRPLDRTGGQRAAGAGGGERQAARVDGLAGTDRAAVDRTIKGLGAGLLLWGVVAELLVNRRHTAHGGARFREALGHAAGRLGAFRAAEAARDDRMRALDLDDRAAESLILRAWEARVISHRQLPAVLRGWREPSHEDFAPRNRWSLF